MPLRSPVGPLRRIFKTQARELSAYYTPKRVEGRNEDGTINVRPLVGECVERSNICTAYSGQLIEVPCGNGFNLLGATGTAMATTSHVSTRPWVESVEPHIFRRGSTYTAVIIGRGFLPSFDIDFLTPEEGSLTINPSIMKLAVRVIDEEDAEVDLLVAADAPLIVLTLAGIAFDNVGSAL